MPQQHNPKVMKKLFKELERLGFEVEQKKNGAYVIIPPDKTKPKYMTHATESSFHPIRRDFRKIYNIDITQYI